MSRKLARIVQIDAVRPIEGADAIEVAQVGGWSVVVRKGSFQPNDRAVYFEIDAFLPAGNPAWQFLMDKSTREFEGRKGHVLKSIRLRGQVSQGLLLGLDVLKQVDDVEALSLGADVSEHLGVRQYETPIPAVLAGEVLGEFPSLIPKTDQERIQNLAEELKAWQHASAKDALTWEVTEKLEGSSCTFAWLDDGLHVCSKNLDLKPSDGNTLWRLATELRLPSLLEKKFAGHRLALQGEIVGNGVQGNPYRMSGQKFFLFDVYDADARRYLSAAERHAVADRLGLAHVPVIAAGLRLTAETDMAALLDMADGPSALRAEQGREGLVFKARERQVSFKAVSNKYLVGQKD